MKNAKNIIFSWVLLALIISGCTTTEETPKGEYATGVIIINEGNFTEANGSVSFYDESDEAVTQDIFANANGVSAGGTLQSVYFYQDLAFIIDQVGNRIEVVEAETFTSIATIDAGLSTPRYMVVANGKGYISNWGDFDSLFNLPDSYVAVIDLGSFTVTKTIKTDNGSEGLIEYRGNVYVANSFSNSIDIISQASNDITGSIIVATGPMGFVEDKNGKIWILSSSFFTGSTMSQLDMATEEVLKSFPIAASAKSLNINGAGDQLYYLSTPFGADAEVRKISIEATEDIVTNTIIAAPNLYGLGIDPVTGIIYLGNHNGFQGNGTVLRYEGGTFLDSFATGIAPNGFLFRK